MRYICVAHCPKCGSHFKSQGRGGSFCVCGHEADLEVV
ncbi:hypothetical protein LCGC14_1577680, partial [marine sediment metagenome]